MTSLAWILAGTLLGVLNAPFLRNLERWSPDLLLSLLLFSSSLTFGSDPQVTASLMKLGLTSGLTALGALVASAAAAYAWRALVGKNLAGSQEGSPHGESSAARSPSPGLHNALPALSLIAGWAAGFALQSTPFVADRTAAVSRTASTLSLSALLLVIGYNLGRQRIWVQLRQYGLIAVTLPMAVGVASVLGAGLASLCLPLPLAEGLAAGAGFGWYSLAGAMALSKKGAEIGAYVFLSNLIREVVAVLAIPLLSDKVSPEVAASLGGATSMDSTLPAMARSFGPQGAAWGLITGTVLSLACPFALGFFMAL